MFTSIAVGLLAIIVLALLWRWASRRWSLPCPTVLSWMVDGPLVDAISGTSRTLDQLQLRPGMTIVEIGPGPGRLLVPAARRVLPGGKAIGIELQQGMIDKLRRKLSRDDPGNVQVLHADATRRILPSGSADLVYLCTVLGEIPDRARALENCFDALRPAAACRSPRSSATPTINRAPKCAAWPSKPAFSSTRSKAPGACTPPHSLRPSEKPAA